MKNNTAIFLTGIGIGIFLGLSESPILLQILVPLLTVIIGLLSVLTGQKSDDKTSGNESNLLLNKNISPFPIMWMVMGMVIGSFIGLLAKNYDITGRGKIFGNSLNENASLTKSSDSEPSKNDIYKTSSTVLHGSKSEEYCRQYQLCHLNSLELLCALKDIENPEIEQMLSKNEINLDSIKLKIKILCNCQQ